MFQIVSLVPLITIQSFGWTEIIDVKTDHISLQTYAYSSNVLSLVFAVIGFQFSHGYGNVLNNEDLKIESIYSKGKTCIHK